MNIVFIGFKSCGKSTVGFALARRLALGFVDTDRMLEELHADQTGEMLSFRDIYRRYGHTGFAALEQQVITQLADFDNYVIAAGGQTLLNHALPPALRARARIVYLDVAPAILLGRIQQSGVPPFLAGEDVAANVRRLYAERHPRYQQLADHRIDASQRTVDELVAHVMATLELSAR